MKDDLHLPVDFTSRVKAQLGKEYDAFVRSFSSPAPTSVLLNPAKSSALPFENMSRVPWNPNGYVLDSRPEFVFDPAFHAGAYYVMEAASMLLSEALEACPLPRDPTIVDLCAAPGGKSMVALNYLKGNGLLVANEVNRKRFGVLNENITKWGHLNIITSNLDPSRLGIENFADCVIVDAPCSGEGLFRKTPGAIEEWNPANARHCSLRQQRILNEAMKLVRPGGCLIYSTCTYNPDENIKNVSWLAKACEAESIELEKSYNASEVCDAETTGYQCWPHRMKGEGFFLAILRKRGPYKPMKSKSRQHASRLHKAKAKECVPWDGFVDQEQYALYTDRRNNVYALPKDQANSMLDIGNAIPGSRIGLLTGEVKGDNTVPSHALALSLATPASIGRIRLSAEQAISYLRRDSLPHMILAPGWYLADHEGHDLGWIKQTAKHTKNYFPIDLRIRKQRS